MTVIRAHQRTIEQPAETPYEQGYLACLHYRYPNSNPYSPSNPDYHHWRRGYWDGYAEREAALPAEL
jgi:hypothetical protein